MHILTQDPEPQIRDAALSHSPGLISCTAISTGHATDQVPTYPYLACSTGQDLCLSTGSIPGAARVLLRLHLPLQGSTHTGNITDTPRAEETGSLALSDRKEWLRLPGGNEKALESWMCMRRDVPIFTRPLSLPPWASGCAISRNSAGQSL